MKKVLTIVMAVILGFYNISFAQTNKDENKEYPVDFNIWPKGEPNTLTQYFTGNSYLAP